MTPDYFARVSPTYIENWAAGLYDLSIPHVGIPVEPPEASALLARNEHHARPYDERSAPSLDGLAGRIDAAMRSQPGGSFVRLGSRSAKDSRFARARGLRVTNERDALLMLTTGSRRVSFDLRLALRFAYEPRLFVREWVAIPAWAEFRCFMRGRRLVGVSQYDVADEQRYAEIAERRAELERALRIFAGEFASRSHLADVVFDVFVTPGAGSAEAAAARVRLLELNPFLPRTNSCLFDWRRDDFDGSFRYL